ncbi:MAG: hypothetical protein U1E45_00250 [Geminicoccaceae bacterium]
MAAFSWEGADEGEPTSGRGTLVWQPGDRLEGHIYFHNGDDSAFACERHPDPGRPRRGRVQSSS